MKKQITAVEWLEKEIFRRYKFTLQQLNCNPLEEAIQQAKEMEKSQHKKTFEQSRQAEIFEKDTPPVWESFEQYYNETFKNK